MPVIEDRLWKNPGTPGMIVVTSHAWVDEDGRLFMGYGEAKEAIRRIPEIEYQCGELVRAYAENNLYGFLPVRPPRPEESRIGFGIFQTRYHWNESADPDLIGYSMQCLREYTAANSSIKIRMSYPGIGGGLPSDRIDPLLIPLPPNVTICHQGEVERTAPVSFEGFKALYIEVEGMLQEGRYSQAVELLVHKGFDIQSAIEQVDAVQRILKARFNRDKERLARFNNRSI